jgi:hypothetical protein
MVIDWEFPYIESKYSRWYEELITKALNRKLPKDAYKEKHHIVPRSFGGSNDKSNIAVLTAREHYIAHALLWKMNFSGVYGHKMAYAFNTFIRQMHVTDDHNYKINSKIYESFRIMYSKLLSETQKGEKNHFFGKKHSDETKRLIGEKSKKKLFKRGPENPSWGKKLNLTEEQRQLRSTIAKKIWEDLEFREKILKKRALINQRPDIKAKRRAAADKRIGVKRDPATVEKTAAAKRGKKWEEIYSPETIEKMLNSIRNRELSEDAKARIAEGRSKGCRMPKPEHWKKKMSERMTGIKRRTVVCEHCGKECVTANYNRWHGNNCKNKLS